MKSIKFTSIAENKQLLGIKQLLQHLHVCQTATNCNCILGHLIPCQCILILPIFSSNGSNNNHKGHSLNDPVSIVSIVRLKQKTSCQTHEIIGLYRLAFSALLPVLVSTVPWWSCLLTYWVSDCAVCSNGLFYCHLWRGYYGAECNFHDQHWKA